MANKVTAAEAGLARPRERVLPDPLVDDSRVWQDVDELQKRFGSKWGKTLREQKVSALADDIVAEMKAWG